MTDFKKRNDLFTCELICENKSGNNKKSNNKVSFIDNNPNLILVKFKVESIISFISDKMLNCLINSIISTNIKYNLNKSVTIIGQLGRGSFGVVLLVKINFKLYAMKIIKHNQIYEKDNYRRYLEGEINNSKIIISPFKEDIKGMFYNDYFITLLFSFSTSLNLKLVLTQLIKKKELIPITEVYRLFINLLVAVKDIHDCGILHRDIKPENILITVEGYLKIIDFGLSKKTNNFTNTTLGSPYYMSPEQIKGEFYGKSADYWSLGIVLYELIYGCNPFKRSEDNVCLDIYQRILFSSLDFPITRGHYYNNVKQDINNPTFLKLKTLCSKMLDKNIENRFYNYFDIINHLKDTTADSIKDLNYKQEYYFQFNYFPQSMFNSDDYDLLYDYLNENGFITQNKSLVVKMNEFNKEISNPLDFTLNNFKGIDYTEEVIISLFDDKEDMLCINNIIEREIAEEYLDWLKGLQSVTLEQKIKISGPKKKHTTTSLSKFKQSKKG